MATAVVMPQLGNSVESSIIVAWKKQKGEQVSAGEIICEVETDKATIDVESPASGVLLETFFAAGDDVPVKVNIAAIGEPGEDAESLRPDGSTTQSAVPVVSAAAPAPARAEINGASASAAPVPATMPVTGEKPGVSPRARSLAARKEVDLSNIVGTGPGGRIIERDVQAALESQPRLTPVARSMVESGEYVAPDRGSGTGGRVTKRDLLPATPAEPAIEPAPVGATHASPLPAASLPDEIETIPLKGMRKVIATRMLESMQTTAQLTLNTSADARAVLAYRERLKNSAEALGLQKVTVNDLILFVTARTLLQFPELNALFQGDSIARYKQVHLGFAVDTPRGLIVPVIRGAHMLSLRDLSAEAKRLGAACLNSTIKPDEISGGTFTVTNLGSLGIESFTPILNPPQVAILGVSAIVLKPVELDGKIQLVKHIGLSLTINHQVVDGAPAARFLQALTQNIAGLELMLAL
jgi:pyruvate dehydrogenase E2 component (dihydrolipoamide acetyltransferase)